MGCTEGTAVRGLAAGLAVAGVLAGAAPVAAGEAAKPVPLRILVLNPAGVPERVLLEAERVAGRLFRRAGVEPAWLHPSRDGSPPPEGPHDADLRTVVIVNVMSAKMEARAHQSSEATGYSVPGGRMANVMYGRVEALMRIAPADVRGEIGAVLGHVIAHELAHLFLPPRAHSAGGLMSATLDPRQAAQGVLWFSEAEASRLRAGLLSRDAERGRQARVPQDSHRVE